MENPVNLSRYMNIIADIMMDKFKILVAEMLFEVIGVTCDEVVHSDNLMAFTQKTVYEV